MDLTMPPTTKLILIPLALLCLLAKSHCILDIEMGMGLEMEMGSEAHTRLLREAAGEGRYISYDALRGDVVPCPRPGVPYYNCKTMTEANPYTRGCEIITMCRDSDP